jgi:hypothetical protein
VQAVTLTDLSSWPVAVLRYSENYGDAEVRAFLADMTALLGRGEPFALAIVTHPAQFARTLSPETHRAYALGVKGNRGAMQRLCRGLAFVVADEGARDAYAAKVAANGPKVFGAPMRVFTTLREARAWLATRLTHASKGTL